MQRGVDVLSIEAAAYCGTYGDCFSISSTMAARRARPTLLIQTRRLRDRRGALLIVAAIVKMEDVEVDLYN